MFKILVATDGSANATRGIEFAAKMASKIEDATVTILYVRPLLTSFIGMPEGMPMPGFIPESEQIQQALQTVAKEALDSAELVLKDTGRPTTKRNEQGNPAEVICRIGDADQFDLVILGSRGYGEIAGIFMGSVSNRVTHYCHVPVMVVR